MPQCTKITMIIEVTASHGAVDGNGGERYLK